MAFQHAFISGVWSDAFSFACRRSISFRLSRQASMRVAKWNTQKAIQRLSDLAAFQHKHARLFEGRWAWSSCLASRFACAFGYGYVSRSARRGVLGAGRTGAELILADEEQPGRTCAPPSRREALRLRSGTHPCHTPNAPLRYTHPRAWSTRKKDDSCMEPSVARYWVSLTRVLRRASEGWIGVSPQGTSVRVLRVRPRHALCGSGFYARR